MTGEHAAEGAVTAPGQPGAALLRLVGVMDTLRAQCPWDARQTHESLAPHLLEESYEALEALETGGPAALRDELGDVLLQVVFHARIAAERTDGTGYTIDDVADGIVAKLTRRHPHVFGDVSVSGPEEVKRNWDAIKAAERAGAGGTGASALDSVPFGQPALALAAQLQRRAERAGAPAGLAHLPVAGPPVPGDPPTAPESTPVGETPAVPSPSSPGGPPVPGGPPTAPEHTLTGETPAVPGLASPGGPPVPGDPPAAPVHELAADAEPTSHGESPAALEPSPGAAGVSWLGAELFALVSKARAAGLDPERELRAAARCYADRVRAWERTRR